MHVFYNQLFCCLFKVITIDFSIPQLLSISNSNHNYKSTITPQKIERLGHFIRRYFNFIFLYSTRWRRIRSQFKTSTFPRDEFFGKHIPLILRTIPMSVNVTQTLFYCLFQPQLLPCCSVVW